MEIWIPEVVVWELAAHLWEDLDKGRQSLASVSAALRGAGLDPPPALGYEDADALVRLVEDQVSSVPGVVVVECTPEDAVAALRDQVLGRPPGRKRGKDSIRTGAADSAALRSVSRFDPAADLVVVSNDDDVSRALVAWDVKALHFRTSQEARDHLFAFGVGPLELSYSALALIRERLASGGPLEHLTSRYLDSWAMIEDDLPTDLLGLRVTGVEVKELGRLVGARPIRTSPIRTTFEGRASIEVLVTAVVNITVEKAGEAALGELQPPPWGCVLRLPLWIEVKDGKAVNVGAEEAAGALFNPVVWHDPSEALEDCLDAFFNIPELRRETLHEPGVGDHTVPVYLHSGVEAHIQATVDESGWTLTSEGKGASISLRSGRGRLRSLCTVMVTEDGEPSSLPPAYALSAFWLRLNLEGG